LLRAGFDTDWPNLKAFMAYALSGFAMHCYPVS
jgi:hypothetical protein